MGHEITNTDNVFSVREMPWHQLGTVFEDYPSREEAQKLAHPWEPVTEPIFRAFPVVNEDGTLTTEYREVKESKAVVRSDNSFTLGVVNDSYEPVNNSEMYDIAEAIQGESKDVKFETGGSLDGGRKVWLLLRLEEPLEITGDLNGAVVPYFALQNSHNGSTAFRGQATNVRIVCANTSHAADVDADARDTSFSFRHTKNVRERIEEARTALGMWREQVQMWKQTMEHLVTVELSDEQIAQFIEGFQPYPTGQFSDRVRNNVDNARGEVRSILASPTSEGIENTAYGVVQAGLEYAQHVRRTRGKTDRSRMENRFRRAVLTDDRLGRDLIDLAYSVM